MRGRARLRMVAALACAAAGAPLAAPGHLAAQEARVRSAVDTTLVTVGDRIRMTVTVEHAAGARVLWPDSLDLRPFEILEAEALPPSAEGERVRSGVILTLAAFELGALEIPSFEVEVLGPGDASEILETDRFGIEVVSVGTDEGGDIRDIRGPLAIPVGVVTVSLWLLLLLALVGAAFWLGRRFRRRGEGPSPEPSVPARPPHEVALEDLARIEASPLLEQGRVKEFHIAISETLRVYVEARFGVPALEMTTREVTQGLLGSTAPQSFTDGLRRFLDRCDLVKFAKVRPEPDASRGTLAEGRALVESTIPRAEASPAPAVGEEG